MTIAEYVETYLFAQYQEWERVLRQQVAVAAGIQTGAFGKPQLTMDDLFHGRITPMTEGHEGLKLLNNFPYDTPMLPEKSVIDLLNFSKRRHDGIWDEARGHAALNENDRLLSRVAQDDYLWVKWQHAITQSGVIPSVDIVRQWAENQVNKRLLTPPGYFIDKCRRKGLDPQTEWVRSLGPSYKTIQDQLFSGMIQA